MQNLYYRMKDSKFLTSPNTLTAKRECVATQIFTDVSLNFVISLELVGEYILVK